MLFGLLFGWLFWVWKRLLCWIWCCYFCLSGCFDLMLIFGCFTFCGLCLRFDACGFVVFKLIDLFFGLVGVLVVVLLLVFWFG